MNRKTMISSLLTAVFLVPVSAAAFEVRRDYSKYWDLTGVERKVDLEDQKPGLNMDLRNHQIRMSQHEEDYQTLREGLNYEKATLARERESLDETVERNRLIERDILSRMTIYGVPKHLKRWQAQRRLQNALKILEEDSAVPYKDLERREALLAKEADKLEASYLAKRGVLQRQESNLRAAIAALANNANYATTDRRNVFLGSILKPEREDFINPRKMRYTTEREKNASRMKAAVTRAKTDNYLTRSNPQVQSELAAEITKDAVLELKFLENLILESLGSNIAPEEIQRLQLKRFMLMGN